MTVLLGAVTAVAGRSGTRVWMLSPWGDRGRGRWARYLSHPPTGSRRRRRGVGQWPRVEGRGRGTMGSLCLLHPTGPPRRHGASCQIASIESSRAVSHEPVYHLPTPASSLHHPPHANATPVESREKGSTGAAWGVSSVRVDRLTSHHLSSVHPAGVVRCRPGRRRCTICEWSRATCVPGESSPCRGPAVRYGSRNSCGASSSCPSDLRQ